MEGSIVELSRYRFQTALDDIKSSKILLDQNQYKASVNRSYYAIFHLMRAVTALDKFDSSKHSGVISYFNKNYVKEGIFDKEISKLIDMSYRLRENADYKYFYVVSRNQACEQINRAEKMLEIIQPYLEDNWQKV